jgi:hypothetical protein
MLPQAAKAFARELFCRYHHAHENAPQHHLLHYRLTKVRRAVLLFPKIEDLGKPAAGIAREGKA